MLESIPNLGYPPWLVERFCSITHKSAPTKHPIQIRSATWFSHLLEFFAMHLHCICIAFYQAIQYAPCMNIKQVVMLGEGQSIEFKETAESLDKEIVAFANAAGGTIYCGITDAGIVKGIAITNRIRSQIQDVARNCDPTIHINIKTLDEGVLAIHVPEGAEKPYQCSRGFFLRMGANSQKLTTSEIRDLLTKKHTLFDARLNLDAPLKEFLSMDLVKSYCAAAGIEQSQLKRNPHELLESLLATGKDMKGQRFLTNAGVLLFTQQPSLLIPESSLTLVRYTGTDKFSIDDRIDITGNLIEQMESATQFVRRHVQQGYRIDANARRLSKSQYPLVALREAIINAIVHRDYSFQNSHSYISLFSDRIEIENPGGIMGGIPFTEIEGRSIRRNPILADLLYRAGYGEKLGSGLIRIRESLRQNNNPPYQISSVNFFTMRLLPAATEIDPCIFSDRQLAILRALKDAKRPLSSAELSLAVGVSSTTITREVKRLLMEDVIAKIGVGKQTKYSAKS